MSSVSYSVSTENLCLAEEEEDLIGDDSFCLIGGNSSLDEIIPEEVGIDVSLAQDEQFDRRSTALQDDDMALHFPPWKITRIMLDLKEISLDAGRSRCHPLLKRMHLLVGGCFQVSVLGSSPGRGVTPCRRAQRIPVEMQEASIPCLSSWWCLARSP